MELDSYALFSIEESVFVIEIKSIVQCIAENEGDGNDLIESSEDLPTLLSDDIKATCDDT